MTAELCGVVERLRDGSGTISLPDLKPLADNDGRPGGVGADERVLVARKGLKPESFASCSKRIAGYLRKCQAEYLASTGSTGVELADLTKAGNRTAFDTLVQWKEPFLKRLIHQTFGTRKLSREDREDVLQTAHEAFCKEVRRFDSRRGTRIETFAAYGVRGALLKKRRDLDAWARRVRNRGESINDPLVLRGSAEAGCGISEAENQKDVRELILRAKLSPRETKVIEIRYFRARSSAEFAREGRFSEAYVAKLHTTAIKKLRAAAGL